MAELIGKFKQYYGDIVEEMTGSDSILETHISRMEEQFKRFGFTNEQIAQVLTQVYTTSIEATNANASQSALQLLRIENEKDVSDKQAESIDADIALKECQLIGCQTDNEIKIIEKDILGEEYNLKLCQVKVCESDYQIKLVDLQIRNHDEYIRSVQEDITDQELLLKTCQVEGCGIDNQIKRRQLTIADKDIALKDAELELNTQQKFLVERQRRGYDDNMLIKVAEFQGGLASFAVNANSDSAQDTIDTLHEKMKAVEDRVCGFVCGGSSFTYELDTEQNVPADVTLFGYPNTSGELVYTVVENPLQGSVVIAADGTATYTPDADVLGHDTFTAKIEDTEGEIAYAYVSVTVSAPPPPIGG